MPMNGKCLGCDFYINNECKKAGNFLSQMDDPVCLAKLQVILLQDLVELMTDYMYGDDE
jgi:hypothetical protein